MTSQRTVLIAKATVFGILAVFTGLLLLAPFLRYNLFFLQRTFLFYFAFWIIMAISTNIIYGFTGYLPFGFVAFYGVGAYTLGIIWHSFQVPVVVGILAAGVTGPLLGIIFAPTLRLRGIYFAIVNFAFALIVRTIVAVLPEDFSGGSFGISMVPLYDPISAYYAMLFLAMVASVTLWWLSRSKFGIALRSIKEDPQGAGVLGINVYRCRLYAWLLSALFPSIAGAIDAWYTVIIDPATSFDLIITARAIIYPMLGGFGTVMGPILGSTLLYTLDEIVWASFPLSNMLVTGAVLTVLVLFLPKGILGTLHEQYPGLKKVFI